MKTCTRNRLFAAVTALILVMLPFLPGCCGSASGTVTEAGSTTVQPLAEVLAEAFQQKAPGIKVTIQGGGSSVGVKACADGTVDIGAVSRDLKPGEADLTEHLLARDAISVIVHPSNAVSDLTRQQVKEIFAGTITNWRQVGGTDKAIHVVAREEGSGTRTAFEEMLMGGEGISSRAIVQATNGAIRIVVAGDSEAVGFISLGYVNNGVKSLTIDGAAATVANAQNGSYPAVRPLYFLTRGEPTGAVREFIDFCLSAEGQAIVAAEGYVPRG
ncbi:MAG: phosphate ABC transporter substrate-binding protein [Chloroflexi bacterium]|nr:phosphate ABC transporter substrate-binding protein [Chloroflexota bacterium]